MVHDNDADDDVQIDAAAVADHVPPVVAAAEPASQDIRQKLLLITMLMSYRLAPRLMTLDDLELL